MPCCWVCERTRKACTRCLVAGCLLIAAGSARAVTGLVADYQFANDLASSAGTASPRVVVGPGTALASEIVRVGQPQTVLTLAGIRYQRDAVARIRIWNAALSDAEGVP